MTTICHELHQLFCGLPKTGFPFEIAAIPRNGIYVLFEEGERSHGTDRIVRVGTHTGNNQLPSRLQQHYVNENKDRSIFRKNIGRAILNKNADPLLAQWDLDLTTSEARRKFAGLVDRKRLQETERRVTEYIQRCFRFVVLRVDDAGMRRRWESEIISTVSLCTTCAPSPRWLGLQSPKAKIRESGMWLVNELYKQPLSQSDFDLLKRAVVGGS